jgi:3-hydroxybutyryl-CoA dehydrogenase
LTGESTKGGDSEVTGNGTSGETVTTGSGAAPVPGALGERIALVGGGAIACGLAATVACHGEVVMWARSSDSASRARGSVERACGRHVAEAAQRIRVTTEVEDLAGATFVVESIAEDLGAKRDLLGRLHRLVEPDAVLATTTSALPVEELAAASGRPDRFVAFHPFNPVTRMKLIELAFPAQADEETRRRAHALCHALGKSSVEVPATPGFVVNRLLFPYLFEAVRLMERTGLGAEDIDECMTLGAGHPMGPLALLDFVGLDVAVAIGDGIGVEVPERLRRLVAEGRIGRKSGSGLHGPRPQDGAVLADRHAPFKKP